MQEHPHNDAEAPKHWPKEMPFQVPSDYFARQRKEILRALQHEWKSDSPENVIHEIDRLSPLLSELKRRGINGRWKETNPILHTLPDEKETVEEKEIKPSSVRRINKPFWWAAAALLTGLWLVGKIMTQRSDITPKVEDAYVSASSPTDSIGFSSEEIISYLAETVDFTETMDKNTSISSGQELFLASADLMIPPAGYTQQLESIPIHELEAYIREIPSIND